MDCITTEDYVIALQQAIERHCNGEKVPKEIADKCPHHAQLLDKDMSNWQAHTDHEVAMASRSNYRAKIRELDDEV